MHAGSGVDFDSFLTEADAWLSSRRVRRVPLDEVRWGEGTDDVAVFRNLGPERERAVLDAARAWQRAKSDAGYGSISWPVEYGGAGLPVAYEEAFRLVEQGYEVPTPHEAVALSIHIEAPTILALGTDEQRAHYVEPLRRTDVMCCQLFSEPGAGSDLGSLSTRAVADGDSWTIDGQKVWSSAAEHADLGYLLARTDPTAPRQSALTAFLVPMRTPGVEVRPLRQMTGSASFSEVFLTDVQIPDSCRLGPVGGGWQAAMTTLGFERVIAARGTTDDTSRVQCLLVLLARHLGRDRDPVVRQELSRLHGLLRVRDLNDARARARLEGGDAPGPEGSLAKLAFSRAQVQMTTVASLLLGPRLAADTGEWGTFSWSELVLGAPGMRLAGGTDEIQRNTIAERVLGLPRGPR